MKKTMILTVVVMCHFTFVPSVYAVDTSAAVQAGAQWLIDRQGDRGGWEPYGDYSAYAVRAFIAAGRTDSPQYQLVLNRLLSLKADDGTYPGGAMAIWALADAGYTKDDPELQAAVNYLLDHHDPINCWGTSPSTNSFNIIALIKSGVLKTHPVIQSSANWLKMNQNPNGYWGIDAGGENNTDIGGLPITALCLADNINSVNVQNAVNWLYSQRSGMHFWGLSSALEAFVYAEKTSQSTEIKNIILNEQKQDGGWAQWASLTTMTSGNTQTAYGIIALCGYGLTGSLVNNGLSWIETHIVNDGVYWGNYQYPNAIATPALYSANIGQQQVQDAMSAIMNWQASNGSWSWWSLYKIGSSPTGEIVLSSNIINYIYDCQFSGVYPTNLQKAVNYIYTGKNTDGGWGVFDPYQQFTPSSLYHTCRATEALLRYGYTSSNSVVAGGLSWILGHMEGVAWGNCADTARAIKVLHRAGGYDGIEQTAVDWLYANQNPDGGWGSRLNESSTVGTTSEVLIDLGLLGHSNNSMARAAQWLVSAQNADGGWASRPRVNASDTTNTSYAVWALSQDFSGAGDLGVTVIADSNSYYNGETAAITVTTSEDDCILEASVSDPEGWNKRIYFTQDDPNSFHIDLPIDQYRLGTYTVLVQASTAGGNEGSGIMSFGVRYDYVIPGDVNKDGKVDFSDFVIMSGNWLKEEE